MVTLSSSSMKHQQQVDGKDRTVNRGQAKTCTCPPMTELTALCSLRQAERNLYAHHKDSTISQLAGGAGQAMTAQPFNPSLRHEGCKGQQRSAFNENFLLCTGNCIFFYIIQITPGRMK